ncbi:MAG: tetratricopeptide repeat protein [Pseudobutyrivibrio sp.]|nr:tetratricopeptide repeat protein [Pseudobutyrivibrio sp.]
MKKKLLILGLTLYMAATMVACGGPSQKEIDLRDQGIEALDAGDYETAIKLFNKALGCSIGRVSDLEIDINYYKAAAQFKSGDFEGAAATYEALIKYDGDNYEPYFLRGSIYASEREVGKAILDYDKAVEVDKKNYLLYIEIYENLDSLGYTDQGKVYLDNALQISDKSAEGSYYKGRINYMLGQTSQAEELLQKAVDKDIVEARLYLAKIYQDQGDYEKAQGLLEEYAKSEDVTSEALATLGDIEMANGNYENALGYYEAGLSLESIDNMPDLMKGQVSALEHLGRFTEACDALTQYLESYPNDEVAKKELIFLQTR